MWQVLSCMPPVALVQIDTESQETFNSKSYNYNMIILIENQLQHYVRRNHHPALLRLFPPDEEFSE